MKISMKSIFRRPSGSRGGSPATSPTAAASSPPAAAKPLSPEEEMERVFRKFDTNGDGKISAAELAEIFRSVGHPATDDEVARMMQEADADGDGFISLAEFADINAVVAGGEDEEEDLRRAFAVFDENHDGNISATELARVMRGLGEPASVAQCKRMIDGVDKDGDGKISFEEFKSMMANGAGAFAALGKLG